MPDVDVWIVPLDAEPASSPPTPAEAAHARRLVSADLQRRYLRSHAALRAILRNYTPAPLDFATGAHGKPYLPGAPEVHFNLSHSHELALVAVALEVEIGVDVERYRPLPQCLAIAERFFPPLEAAALADVALESREAEFSRRWTRIEAKLKARGIGIYGAGTELDGEWSVLTVDVGPDYAASVAANRGELTLRTRKL